MCRILLRPPPDHPFTIVCPVTRANAPADNHRDRRLLFLPRAALEHVDGVLVLAFVETLTSPVFVEQIGASMHSEIEGNHSVPLKKYWYFTKPNSLHIFQYERKTIFSG